MRMSQDYWVIGISVQNIRQLPHKKTLHINILDARVFRWSMYGENWAPFLHKRVSSLKMSKVTTSNIYRVLNKDFGKKRFYQLVWQMAAQWIIRIRLKKKVQKYHLFAVYRQKVKTQGKNRWKKTGLLEVFTLTSLVQLSISWITCLNWFQPLKVFEPEVIMMKHQLYKMVSKFSIQTC